MRDLRFWTVCFERKLGNIDVSLLFFGRDHTHGHTDHLSSHLIGCTLWSPSENQIWLLTDTDPPVKLFRSNLSSVVIFPLQSCLSVKFFSAVERRAHLALCSLRLSLSLFATQQWFTSLPTHSYWISHSFQESRANLGLCLVCVFRHVLLLDVLSLWPVVLQMSC